MTDINDRIQRLTVWCLVISCLVHIALGSSLNASAAGGYCRPRNAPNPMPKRASVIRRDSMMDAAHVNGCVDLDLLHATDLVAVVHLRQEKRIDNFGVSVRVSPPPEGFSGRLTLLLHSTFPLKWRLDLSELLPTGKKHRVVLTHADALSYSEQLHAERYLHVERMEKLGAARETATQEQRLSEDTWELLEHRMRIFGLEPPAFVVSVRQQRALPMNAVEVRLPGLLSNRSGSGLGCQPADFQTLARLVDAALDTLPDAGFASCRSQAWESDGKIRPLLQLLEFSREFQPKPDFRMEVRLTAPSTRLPGAAQRVVVAIFLSNPFLLRLDTRSVRREITVLSNMPLPLAYPGYRGSELVNMTVVDSQRQEDFLDLVLSQLEGGAAGWSVERLTLAESMEVNLRKMHPTLVVLRLHEAPLLLHDMEPWVHFKCFETKDMVVVVPRRVFDALGVDKSQVLLGGDPKCTMYENATRWWVWKVLLNGDNSCSTSSKNYGSHTTVYNWLSVNASASLGVYRLFISCMFRHDSGGDLPPEEKQSDSKYLWQKHAFVNTSAAVESVPQLPVVEDFSLELFLDKEMRQSVSASKVTLKTNQRLFGRIQPRRMSVEPGLMVRDCVITGGPELYTSKYKHYILHHGCEMGAYFVWNEADSYRMKSFSFELPRPSFFSEDSTFFLHCLIQPCNYFHLNAGLPRCWNQRVICYFPSMPAPLKLVAGPFHSLPVSQKERRREEGVRIPLWGAILIAGFAFVFGVAGAGLLWLVHHLTRRRGRRRRRSQLAPDGPAASVLLRMNARHLEQERCRLIHVGVTRSELLWGQEAFRG